MQPWQASCAQLQNEKQALASRLHAMEAAAAAASAASAAAAAAAAAELRGVREERDVAEEEGSRWGDV